ncbi:uncharacterized protein TNCV_2400801 [Trichonephila clavipes]|nr:uncharacterized protein TNCV_2400801 [Trichonephila clavipes]
MTFSVSGTVRSIKNPGSALTVSSNDENGGHIMEIAQGELVQKEPDKQPVDRAEELFTSHALIQKRQNSQLIDLYRQECM